MGCDFSPGHSLSAQDLCTAVASPASPALPGILSFTAAALPPLTLSSPPLSVSIHGLFSPPELGQLGGPWRRGSLGEGAPVEGVACGSLGTGSQMRVYCRAYSTFLGGEGRSLKQTVSRVQAGAGQGKGSALGVRQVWAESWLHNHLLDNSGKVTSSL